MGQYLQAFILGNGAILTNVCLLPLYPGLIAFLAGNANNERSRNATPWLGLFVLAGVLTLMTLMGLLIFLLNQSFGALLPWLLPLIYLVVIALGIMMLFGYNPFNNLGNMQSPIFKNPFASAYIYGLMLGPMTLPCTGPIILTAFVLGAGSVTALADGLLYFLFFGLGFGWPLVLLPILAGPIQKRSLGWMTKNYKTLTRISGILLVGIGLFGVWTEIIPKFT